MRKSSIKRYLRYLYLRDIEKEDVSRRPVIKTDYILGKCVSEDIKDKTLT